MDGSDDRRAILGVNRILGRVKEVLVAKGVWDNPATLTATTTDSFGQTITTYGDAASPPSNLGTGFVLRHARGPRCGAPRCA